MCAQFRVVPYICCSGLAAGKTCVMQGLRAPAGMIGVF